MRDEPSNHAGWPRRDALKAIAMLAAAPLAAQAGGAAQTATESLRGGCRRRRA